MRAQNSGDKLESVVLGLGGSSHDFAAVIARNGDIRVGVEEERLTRRKHGGAWWYQNPVARSVEYCLAAEGLNPDDVSAVVSSDLLPLRVRAEFPVNRIRLYPHHLCHAASGLLLLPPNTRAGVIVYDGMGSTRRSAGGVGTRETFSFFLQDTGRLTKLGETTGRCLVEDVEFPMGSSNSIGHFYELVTLTLGFGAFEEGKTMGLAAHGHPRFLPALRSLVTMTDDMNDCFRVDPIKSGAADVIEQLLRVEGYSFLVRADMAASIQSLIEEVLLHCWKLLSRHMPDVVVVAGGCGLNSLANGMLSARLPTGIPLIVPPYPGDSGLGFGAIKLWHDEQVPAIAPLTFRGEPISPKMARPGRIYSSNEIEGAITEAYPRVARDGAVRGPKEIAKLIAEGKIIGCFSRGSEIGPRALGNRSILADSRSSANREHINRGLKKREPFRPLAPIILRSRFDNFFLDPRQADDFMVKVASVRPERAADIPAVVHVDGTARVQVIDEAVDPFMTEVLLELEALTGIPVIVNTSFNRRGEPIVETPRDAIDCCLGLGLDGLWLQHVYVFPLAD